MIRKLAVSLALLTSTAAVAEEAQTPVNTPPAAALKGAKKLPPQWETTAREIYKTAVETPTVKGRAGENLKLANYLAGQAQGRRMGRQRHPRAAIHVGPGERHGGDHRSLAGRGDARSTSRC